MAFNSQHLSCLLRAENNSRWSTIKMRTFKEKNLFAINLFSSLRKLFCIQLSVRFNEDSKGKNFRQEKMKKLKGHE
jgi:hypothetical protein